ncbi:MAG: alpha-L-arabinofuranosidase [Lachnospiraceae bacterium]|nr:alpha-L-arabinofuranosidase [Lachnospiraceae bacterium]
MAKITVNPAFKVGDISPRLYGTFVEPIGTIVNGVMYNPKHPTADEQGFRRDVIDVLKEAGMKYVRLPGGNFVSCWNWKDSIGPKEERKTHLDMAWYQYITNEVGHDEYLQWAEKCGAEALYTINMGTGDMQSAIDLVEYTNHEGGTWWSDLRKKYGHEKPYGVKLFYLGNEMDGPWQLGSWDKDPRGYGVRVNETSKACKWVDASIETVVCGSSAPFMAHFPEWDETVLTECYESVDYISVHHYHIAPPGDLKSLLGGSVYYEDFINTEVAMLDLVAAKLRTPKKVMISFDEYASMMRPLREPRPGYGYHNMVEDHYKFDPNRQYILHDPDNMKHFQFPGGDMVHALTLGGTQLAFLRHADRVKIACYTSGIGALCASDHDHVWKSASYYVLTQLMKYGHGVSLQVAVDCERFDIPGYAIDDNSQYTGKKNLPYIDSAAAYDEESGDFTLFVINRHETDAMPLELDMSAFEGFKLDKHIELYSDDFEAKNSYEEPDKVVPHDSKAAKLEGGRFVTEVKPLSWNVIHFSK